jgi:hypothetical protein
LNSLTRLISNLARSNGGVSVVVVSFNLPISVANNREPA